MARCDVCGNDYSRSMVITMPGRTGTFDSFECALHAMAPVCEHCGCRIVGHGVEAPDGRYFCCANCAQMAGIPEGKNNA
jgi:phage terminase large subunit GpA-like protein